MTDKRKIERIDDRKGLFTKKVKTKNRIIDLKRDK
jgi:hypothetical protein